MSTPSDKTLRLERTKLNPQPPRGRQATLFMALIAGLAAAVLVYLFLQRQPTPAAPAAPVVKPMTYVVEATKDIPLKTVITPDMVKTAQVEQDKMVPNVALVPADVVGKLAVNPIKNGDQVTMDSVQANETGTGGLESGIDAGMRAVAIAVDPVSSVADFIRPGDHVDVLATFDGGNNISVTRTILQNVRLLATGAMLAPTSVAPQQQGIMAADKDTSTAANPNNDVDKPADIPNATVLVSPMDAQKLVLAAQKGKITLALRRAGDDSTIAVPITKSQTVTMLPVAGSAPAAAPSAPPVPVHPMPAPPVIPPPPTITVIRGAQASAAVVAP